MGNRSVRVAALALLLATIAMTPRAVGQAMRQPPPLPTTPPFDLSDPSIVDAGSHLFRQTCTGYCHGAEGRLSRAPALRGREVDTRFLLPRIPYRAPPMPAVQPLLNHEDHPLLVGYIQ